MRSREDLAEEVEQLREAQRRLSDENTKIKKYNAALERRLVDAEIQKDALTEEIRRRNEAGPQGW